VKPLTPGRSSGRMGRGRSRGRVRVGHTLDVEVGVPIVLGKDRADMAGPADRPVQRPIPAGQRQALCVVFGVRVTQRTVAAAEVG
jgi:hypothetical protein